MVLAWLGSQTLSEYGAALVGIGSILCVIGLLKDSDKERVLPVAITCIAFGSVLALAPAYEKAGSSAYWRVIAGIAGLTLCFSLAAPSRWFVRFRKPRPGEDVDGEGQKKQSEGPIRADVDTELHRLNLGPGTLSSPEKSLANAAVAIIVGLVLLANGMRLLLKGHDRSSS